MNQFEQPQAHQPERDPSVLNPLQIKLMELWATREGIAYEDTNELALKWIESKHAAQFSAYVHAPNVELPQPDDEAALKQFLDELEDETIH